MVHSLSGKPLDGRCLLNWIPDYSDLAVRQDSILPADTALARAAEGLMGSVATMALTDAVDRLFRLEREALMMSLAGLPLA